MPDAGFGDTIEFIQIKQHYPTRIVPTGPELATWLTPHARKALGGRPFGDGTPLGPTLESERVPGGQGLPRLGFEAFDPGHPARKHFHGSEKDLA
ncbi:MAG: glutathionyl-hydroquinone reductase [Mycobacterium sp.]|nr:glutathionyl-hydroquinone reductase [Mycobacterium sp.]